MALDPTWFASSLPAGLPVGQTLTDTKAMIYASEDVAHCAGGRILCVTDSSPVKTIPFPVGTPSLPVGDAISLPCGEYAVTTTALGATGQTLCDVASELCPVWFMFAQSDFGTATGILASTAGAAAAGNMTAQDEGLAAAAELSVANCGFPYKSRVSFEVKSTGIVKGITQEMGSGSDADVALPSTRGRMLESANAC